MCKIEQEAAASVGTLIVLLAGYLLGAHVTPQRAIAAVPLRPAQVPDVEGERGPSLFALLSIVRIRGNATSTGARIELLTVRAPQAARILIRCDGRGCPARRQEARGGGLLSFRRFQGELPAGVMLELSITTPGELGKYTRFLIRRSRPPAREDACVESAFELPAPCPSPVPPPAETLTASRDEVSELNARGYELLRARRFDPAIRAFVTAAGAAPVDSVQYASSLFGLARSLRLSERVEDALTVIERRIRLGPRTRNSREELAAARRAVRERLRG